MDSSFQVTIPPAVSPRTDGVISLAAGLPVTTPANTYVQKLTVQNNSAHSIRYGDKSVSTTIPPAVNGGTAGKGILILATGSNNDGSFVEYGLYISDRYVAGTPGDVIDYDFIK
jgi:hypothetical protein